jgi:hypothetical protein
MVADRLKRLTLQWGLVGLGMQLAFLYYPFASLLANDVESLFGTENIDVLTLRFGQLKPPAFKFPLESWWLWLFVISLILCMVAIWWIAMRRLFDSRESF